ncbi:MAG: hypothetical protein L3K07_09010 [Thermoplasmata archaeon]|nr:hypothetical protein [Thermoplasmata archaeon]
MPGAENSRRSFSHSSANAGNASRSSTELRRVTVLSLRSLVPSPQQYL